MPYPDISANAILRLASHVGGFAAKMLSTHADATSAIKEMNSVYSGYSYSQLIAAWARMSATHMSALDEACATVQTALNIAADVVVAVKVAVLGELAALAASWVGALAATFVTGGLAAVISQALTLAARKVVEVMEQVLVTYIVSEVLGKAIEPLEHAVERILDRGLRDAAAYLLDVPSGGGTAQSLYIEPEEVECYADKLDSYANDMRRHAADFANDVNGLDFTTSGATSIAEPDVGIVPAAVPSPSPPHPPVLPQAREWVASGLMEHGAAQPNTVSDQASAQSAWPRVSGFASADSHHGASSPGDVGRPPRQVAGPMGEPIGSDGRRFGDGVLGVSVSPWASPGAGAAAASPAADAGVLVPTRHSPVLGELRPQPAGTTAVQGNTAADTSSGPQSGLGHGSRGTQPVASGQVADDPAAEPNISSEMNSLAPTSDPQGLSLPESALGAGGAASGGTRYWARKARRRTAAAVPADSEPAARQPEPKVSGVSVGVGRRSRTTPWNGAQVRRTPWRASPDAAVPPERATSTQPDA
ncbi:hypothetical protein ACFXO9_30925 [Nocardia tengchongensis]|uniref:hypothetical protein n=1 Tax=Nocardia tengchongensis TaxID=2055889 RepID=UPI0036A38917